MAVTAQQLTQLYLAYFGRPPDFDGMIYYTTQSDLTLQQVAANFSASPESQALYGSTSLAGVIDAIYMNLFNRHAEVGGITYWSQQIASGALSPAFAAYGILIGAQNADAIAVANKVQVASDWLAHLDTTEEITGYSGDVAAASARSFLATVDSTTASLTTAETNLDAAIFNATHAVDNTPLTVAISSPSIVEGNNGTKQLVYVVTLNHAATSDVTVSYTTTATGTATPGEDFQAAAGSLTFAAGETTKVVNVTVFGDATVEADETVVLQVTGSGLTNSGATGTGTIVNDDSTPQLTTGIDTIDVSASAGPNTVKGVVDGGTPANSTFSVGDTIHGNGLTTVELVVSVGGTGAFAYIDNVAAVNVIAGAKSTINFNALEWTNVGAINLASGVSGATLHVNSLADEVDLGLGAGVGGTVSATYQDGLYAAIWNSGKGGASYEASAGDVTVHLNTNGNSGGAFFSSSNDLVVGDVVIDGGADKASAFFGASANAGDLTVGDVSLSIGDSGTADVSLFASGDVVAGAIAEAAGDSAAAFVTVSATGDVAIASIGQNVGDVGAAIVSISASGDIVVGGIAQIAGTSGFADVTINGSGDMTVGDISQQVGSGTSATALVDIYAAGGDVSIGNVSQAAGNYVSLSVSTTGDGSITVGDIDQAASSSNAFVGINTDVGAITVGNIDQTVGDSSTASVSINVRSFATATSNVAAISVGTISQVGGDGANDIVNLAGAGGSTTTTSGTTVYGGELSVGGISQVVGDSGYMSVSLTSSFGGDINVGNISQSGGNSASAWVGVSGSGAISVGDVSIAVGDGNSKSAQLSVSGSNDISVGNVSVSMGDGQNLFAMARVENDFGHDLTVGDVSVSVGDFVLSATTSTGSAPFASIHLHNFDASGDMSVGNVAMDLGVTASGSITIEQTAAASMDGGSLTVGDVNLTLADKAVVSVDIDNYATVFTSTSHTTVNNMGALTVGDINVALGTNAVASVSVSQVMNGTNGGTVGEMSIGNINLTSDINSYADFYLHAANYAGGDMDGVDVGNVNISMDDGGSFTFNLSVSDTSGMIDHVTVGDVDVTLGVKGSMNSFSIDVEGGAIGDITVGDISLTLGESGFATTFTVYASATTGDLGSLTVGDLTTTVGKGGDANAHWIYANAEVGNIGSITVGNITESVAKSATLGANWVTISASGDIGSVSVGDVDISVAGGGSMTDSALWVGVFGGGDVGSVSVGDVSLSVAKSGIMNTLLYVSVDGATVDSVSIGNETVTLGANAQAGTNTVYVSATGAIGDVSIGDLTYKVGAGATAGALNYTAKAGAGIGSFTVGDVDLQGAVSAQYHVTAGTDDIGSVSFGDISVAGGAFASVDVNAGTNAIGSLSFGDLSAVSASVTINVTGGDVDAVTIGNLSAAAAASTAVANLHVDVSATGALGDLSMGDVAVNVVSGSANVVVSMNVGTASGDLSIGDIDMMVSSTATTTSGAAVVPTGAHGAFDLNFDAGALTGNLDVGQVTFNGYAGNVLDVELVTGIAGDVHIGAINVQGTGSFGAGDYVMGVGGADVTVDLIKVEGAAASNDLANILGGFAQTGTLTLGTVDYHLFTGGAAAIDVSPYAGNITVIGSAAGDTITTNLGSDTLTGGAGTDTFVISAQSQDLTTLTAFHKANVVTITDFKAGPTSGETIFTNANQFDVAHYAEKSASSADAAFTLAMSTMNDPTQQSDIVAVQVGTDVYVFVDTDGGNKVDEVIKLVGVSTNVLNFADFAS